MSTPFAGVLAALTRQRDITGALVVSESDGIIVDANVQVGVRGAALAALAASIYRKARLAAEAAGFGRAGFLQLEAEHGWVCAIGRGDLVLVVLAGARANVGLVRMEMLRATEALG